MNDGIANLIRSDLVRLQSAADRQAKALEAIAEQLKELVNIQARRP